MKTIELVAMDILCHYLSCEVGKLFGYRDQSANKTMNDNKSELIRNSTAEFLIFITQVGEQSIEACYEDETT